MQQVEQQKRQGPRMTLGAIKTGRVSAPSRVVLYGTEGVGKSTWAADAPSPIFITIEEGSNHLDVARFPKATSYGDVLDAVRTLETEPHDYKTVVIDTIDALEPLVWERTCASRLSDGNKRVSSIEEYGFAKGYVYALDVWRELLDRLDDLRASRGMNVIAIAHAALMTIKSPDTEDFSRYDLKIHHKASAQVREWSEHVLFATTDVALRKINQRMKAVGLGERVVHTTSAPGWVAKTRSNAPPVLPLSYEAWSEALLGREAVEEAVRRCEEMVPKLPEDKHEAARETIAKARASSDPATALRKIENRLLAATKEVAS